MVLARCSPFLVVASFAACDDAPDAFGPDDTTPVADTFVVDTADTTVAPDTADTSVAADTHMDLEPDTGVEPDVEVAPPGPCPETPCAPGELCEDGVCVCDPTPVSFADDIAVKFKTGCGPGCHVYNSTVTSGSAGLNLAPQFAYDELVGVAAFQCTGADAGRVRVAPGDPGASYLIDKLLGRDMCRGIRMPKGRTYWSADDIALIGRWVCQGAIDN